MDKMYIGDGVYVAFDGFSLVLTTENGIEVTNTIVLEPQVWEALDNYVEKLKGDRAGPVIKQGLTTALTPCSLCDGINNGELARVMEENVKKLALQERVQELEAVAKAALQHVGELAEAWQRGALSEHDGKGGIRSNRNQDLLHSLTKVLG